MRSTTLAPLLLLLTHCATPQGAGSASVAVPSHREQLTFGRHAPRVGTQWLETRTFDGSWVVLIARKDVAPRLETRLTQSLESYRVEVLDGDERTLKKVKVTRLGDFSINGEPGDGFARADAKDHTFVLERQGAAVLVEDAQGVELPDKRGFQHSILHGFELGEPDPLLDALPQGPVSVGDTVELPLHALAFHTVPIWQPPSDARATLREVRDMPGTGRVGVFELKYSGGPNPDQQHRIAGTLTVREEDGLVVDSRFEDIAELPVGDFRGVGAPTPTLPPGSPPQRTESFSSLQRLLK